MKINEGKIDRTIRLIIGLVVLYLSFRYSLWWLILAVIALITSVTGYCKLYQILGIDTLGKAKSKKKKL